MNDNERINHHLARIDERAGRIDAMLAGFEPDHVAEVVAIPGRVGEELAALHEAVNRAERSTEQIIDDLLVSAARRAARRAGRRQQEQRPLATVLQFRPRAT